MTDQKISKPQLVDLDVDVLIIGGGPGGYTAAFRAADLGCNVTLLDSRATLGGVCLNVGCIPSKTLLHAAKVIADAQSMNNHGIRFGAPEVDLAGLRDHKEKIIGKLTRGLSGLARQRKVTVLQGTASFSSPRSVTIIGEKSNCEIRFSHCIVAAGSSPASVPSLPYDDPRIIDSTGALALTDVPKRMLVMGGGIIGLEMATVYEALGSRISIVEMSEGLIPGADRDLVAVLQGRLAKRCEAIMLGTRVSRIEALPEGLLVHFTGLQAPSQPELYDRVLSAVGRQPNGKRLCAEMAGLQVDERGFIPVDDRCRTNVPNIFAIGDIVGGPMLAHKATHEGRVAAETIAGHDVRFAPKSIPNIAYTDPEIAWAGLNETEADARGIAYEKGVFPWAASGRALANGRTDGLTKLLVDPVTKKLLGAGIVGVNAGELLAEAVLALETGADIHSLMHAIHAHPTLSESMALAAEIIDGSITDLFMPKARTAV
ncbi:MAG TPA: dihydrolipoyl dehydrogenase [Rhodocyclaceae bacterium]|nr:dihydrolipoyl dehydrogenase [Rhodocyclaceae bacterium]